jgi:hypothetical protein
LKEIGGIAIIEATSKVRRFFSIFSQLNHMAASGQGSQIAELRLSLSTKWSLYEGTEVFAGVRE